MTKSLQRKIPKIIFQNLTISIILGINYQMFIEKNQENINRKRKKTYRFKIIKLWLKIRGIVLFIAFYSIPIFLTNFFLYIFNTLSIQFQLTAYKELINDNLFIASLYLFMILISFLILLKCYKKNIDFFSKENWFISMGKALIPSIIAFSMGFFVAFIIIGIFNLLPDIKFIKDWLEVPNEGFIVLLDYIKSSEHYKVIIWFFYIIVIIPIFEEISFRGFLQDSFQRIFKKYNLDIIFTSFIFSLFHIFSLSNIIFAFIVGLFLSKQRKDNSSINISIWIHGLVNFSGLFSGIIFHYLNNGLN